MPRFYPLEINLKKKGHQIIAGIDEAGRGPMAGPVVSAAVILKERARLPGLTDSKMLSEKKRDDLFKKVINQSIDFAICAVPPETIDKLNISAAIRYANMQCLKHLKHKVDMALVDGIDKQIFETPFITIVKGDMYIKSIAAASILAKVARDTMMKEYDSIYPVFNFAKHKGYGTREHRDLMKKHGLSEIHRKTFKLR